MRLLAVACVVAALGTAAAWADPTAPAAPIPVFARQANLDDDTALASPYHGTWGVAMGGGAALPLGDLSNLNGPGGLANVNVYYGPSPRWSLDVEVLDLGMPYKAAGGGGSQPLGIVGAGVRADLLLYHQDQVRAWVGLGAGLFTAQTVEHTAVDPTKFDTTYSQSLASSSALGLLAGVGASYEFWPDWSVDLELQVLSVDTVGGSSNTYQAALPGLTLRWTYGSADPSPRSVP